MKHTQLLAISVVLAAGIMLGAVFWPQSPFSAENNPHAVGQDADLSQADVSPLPNLKGDYISVGGSGKIHGPTEPQVLGFVQRQDPKMPPKADCSRDAIIYFAKKAPENFQEDKKGLLYGVRTHTNATAVDTPIGRFAGFNSCALVASAILRKAGCRWMRITANAKAVYDAAYGAGWRPTIFQDGGCIVAWNARWDGKRTRIGRGIHARTMPKNRVMFRHVGVTTGPNLSVDNSGITSRPSESTTFRPIRYEAPIYLCPSIKSAIRKRR